jgi:hypothetical protein
MKLVMPKMSSKLIFSAAVSTLAMAAFAIGAPTISLRAHAGAGSAPAIAGLPAPSPALPFLFRR